jgi:hypothetical protein
MGSMPCVENVNHAQARFDPQVPLRSCHTTCARLVRLLVFQSPHLNLSLPAQMLDRVKASFDVLLCLDLVFHGLDP